MGVLVLGDEMSGATLKIDPSKLRKHYLPPTKPCRATWSKEAQYEAKVVENGRQRREVKTSRPPCQPKVIRKKEKAIRDHEATPTSRSTVMLDMPRVYNIMEDRGLSVIKLAQIYGVTDSRMYFILDSQWVTPKSLMRLAKALKVKPADILLQEIEKPKPVKRTGHRAKREKVLIDKRKVEVLLKQKEWLKKDLAEALGISQQGLYNTLDRGRTSKKRLYVMAAALDVLPSEIQPEGKK